MRASARRTLTLSVAVSTRRADGEPDRVNVLAELLRTRLREVRGVTILDRGIERSGIVAFTTQDPGNEEIVRYLSARGINVRLMPMTVLGRYDHDARGLDTLVRASVHYFNNEDEIDRLVAAVRDVVKPS